MRKIFLFLFPLIYLYPKSQCSYIEYAGKNRMRAKLLTMILELIYDVKSKIQAIMFIRKYYYKTSEFQLGELMYSIRKKYARMVFVYKKNANSFRQDELYDYEYFEFLMEIQRTSLEIDKLTHIAEEWEVATARFKRKEESRNNKVHDSLIKTTTKKTKGRRFIDSNMQRQKQMSYMERKKLAWAMSRGANIDQAKEMISQKKESFKDGFDSDIDLELRV